MNKLIKASLIRGLRTLCQDLASMIPAGFVVTPVMVEHLDWSFLYVVIAWLATGLLGGLLAFLQGVVAGLPEAEGSDEE